ncbi:MAG: hypothetical protein QM723_31440 [Myxococcaceae bacterium]
MTALAAAPAGRFGERAATLDRLEVHVFDRFGDPPESAVALRDRLVAENDRVVRELRDSIRAGRFELDAFLREAGPPGRGYDALDLLVQGVMDAGPLSPEQREREPEMVSYQPTPARAVIELARALGPDDVLCDLGAGLGRVVILSALLTKARAIGVEVEPSYCEYARRCVRELNLARVEMICADAREAPLGEANVFFMFTPFRGAILRRVLDRLAGEARARPISVCTFGGVAAEVGREPWLKAERNDPEGIAVFRSAR